MSRSAAILKGQPGAAIEPGLATVAPRPTRVVLAALRVYGLGLKWKALPIVARNHWLI